MAVTDEFKQDVLEVLNEYTAALENQTGPNAAPFMAEDELDETVSMPALKYTENPLTSSRAQPDSYRQVPMVTFFNRIDKLAQHVDDAASGVEELKNETVAARDAANDAAEAANDSREQIEQNEAQRQQTADADHQRAEQDHTASETATATALDVAHHATYVDDSGYIVEYDPDTKTYNRTGKNIRGRDFTIDKVFSSKAEMDAYAALSPRPADDKLKEGNFFLINTGSVEDEDTAKLYIVKPVDGELKPEFLTDMSGARGFTGHTPQFSIGTVTTGSPDSAAAATVTPDGEDAQGNPKYKLNLVIPKGDTFRWADLTAENIAELQRPATEAAAEIRTEWKGSDGQGGLRKDILDTKEAVATQGNTAERQGNAAEQQGNAAVRQGDTAERQGNAAKTQADRAENLNDHQPYIADGTAAHPGDTGYFYSWDYAAQQYKRGSKLSLDWQSMTDAERDALAQFVLGQIGFDDTPTKDSEKAVKSGGIYDALAEKQDTLEFATTAECRAAALELD